MVLYLLDKQQLQPGNQEVYKKIIKIKNFQYQNLLNWNDNRITDNEIVSDP